MADLLDFESKFTYGEDEDDRLRQSLQYGVTQNPDAAAKNQANAKKLDIPMDLVERKPAEINQIATEREIIGKVKNTKHTKNFFSDPDNAAAHHDNVDGFAAIEKTLDVLKSIPGPVSAIDQTIKLMTGEEGFGWSDAFWLPANVAQATANLVEGAARFPDTYARIKEGVGFSPMGYSPLGLGLDTALSLAEPGATQIADVIGEGMEQVNEFELFQEIQRSGEEAERAFEAAVFEGDLEGLSEVLTDPKAVSGFIAQAAPSLLAAWLSGGSMTFMMFLEAMEVSTDAVQFEEMTGQKIDPMVFAQAYAQAGIVGGLLEKIGFRSIFGKKFGTAAAKATTRNPGISAFVGMMGEMGTEGAQAINTNLAVMWNYNPNRKWTEGVLPGMIGGAGAGGAGGAFSAMAQTSSVDSGYGKDLVRAESALQFQGIMDKAIAEMGELNLEGRDKLQVKSFLDNALGTENAVVIPIDDATALFQSNPEIMEEMSEDTREAIQEQLSSGLDVQIPTSEYVLHMSDIHSEIRDIIRNDIDGMNAQEANKWAEEEGGGDQVIRDADIVLEQMDQKTEFGQSAIRVKEAVKQSLIQSGRMREQEADRNAQLHALVAGTVARRAGITPEQVYERFGLQVQGEPLVEGSAAYNQAANNLGLVVAARMPDGEILAGTPGQMHFQLREDERLLADTAEMGFSNEAGEFLTRQEAMDFVQSQVGTVRPHTIGMEDQLSAEQLNELAQGPVSLYTLRGTKANGAEFTVSGLQLIKGELGADEEVVFKKGFGENRQNYRLTPRGEISLTTVKAPKARKMAMDGHAEAEQLFQSSVPDAVAEYRAQEEARPITGEIAQPIRNKDGSYRKNAQGDITGAPEDVKTEKQITEIVNNNVDHMEDPLAQMPSSAEWYNVSGAAIRSVTHGDPQLMEKMVRSMALLSADNQVGGNTTGAVKAIYQLARGEVPAAGRYPNVFRERSETVLAAEDISLETPGASDKVVSFYRNLWDATFLSDKYYGSVTMDIWMARLYGYKTDTFSPAQYRFASMITKRIADAYNEKHDTSLSPDQVQAALWVYSRNRDKYGGNVGADISIADRSAFDTYINRATQNITFEAVPAVNSGQFPELHLATAEQKREYTKQAVRVILNEQGENELFNKIGVPLYRQRPSEGTFEGVVNPNEIFSIVSEKAAGVVDTGKADLAARVLQYIYTQNAVPWFQLDHTATGASQGVAIYHSAQPTPEMEEAFLEHLQTTQHIDADFTRVGDDYFLLNFTDLSNKAFKAKVLKAINTYRAEGMPGAELMEDIDGNVKARANYLADPRKGKEFDGLDWAAPEAVTALENEISNSGVPDLLGWARDRREAVGRLQADFRDENLGTLYQGPNLAPFDTDFKHEVVTPDQLRGYEGAHAADRAAGFLEEVEKGKLEPRRPPSVRREADGTYSVIDGRSGTTAVINAGYQQIPVRVIDDVHDPKTGEVVDVGPALKALYEKAGRAKDHFDKPMEKIAAKVGGVWIDVPLKGRKRTSQKVHDPKEYNGDVSRLKDMLRGTIAVNNLDDAVDAYNFLVSEFTPTEVKNSLTEGDRMIHGYKDIKVVIEVDGVKAEVQINTKDQVAAKEILGHEFYDMYRDLPPGKENAEKRRAAQAIESQLYRDTFRLGRNGTDSMDSVLKAVGRVLPAVQELNQRFGLDIKVSNSALESMYPLWAATPALNFRGGSVSKAKAALLSSSSATGIPSTSSSIADLGIASKSVISNVFTSSESIAESATYSQPKRGSIQFTGDGALISLLEGADPSTFIHESGHFFFEMYKEFAANSPEIAADMQVLLDFIGVPDLNTWNSMTLEDRRNGHERVARAFEAYLFEGKAPALEMQSLFDTFRSWLLDVYKTIRGLNVNLTDEVRQVFDRMLASEEMIREREVADSYQALFKSNEEGEMTPEQWQNYQNLDKAQQNASVGELTRRSLRDLKWVSNKIASLIRASESDIRAKRKAMKEEVTAELENSPVYRAISFVKTGEYIDPEGETHKLELHKIDRTEFETDFLHNYDIPRGWTQKDGMPIDELAEVLGWRSGDEMMQTMLNAPPLKTQIERVTDQRMLETYGDLNNPAKIQQAAEEAVHSDVHTRMLHTELSHLRKRTGVRSLLHKAAKALADKTINRMKIRRIKPWQYSRAEARAARESERALRQGDRESAAEHKRAQILQNHFWRKANHAVKDIDAAVIYLRKFDKPGTRKNLDRDFLDQIDQALEKVGLRPKDQIPDRKRVPFADWIEQHEGEGIVSDPGFMDQLKTQWDEMTYEGLMGLRDHVKNLEHVARHKQKILIAGKLEDFHENMNAAEAESLSVNPQKTDPEDATPKKFEQATEFWRQASAWLMKIEFLAERMDGDKPNGRWWNMLYRPVADAENVENEMLEALHKPLTDIFKSNSFKNLGRKVFINNKAGHFDWNMIMSMALNTGNSYNLDAMVAGFEGKNQQVSHEDVARILNENLTVEDWQTVQNIWDLIDTYWPQIEDLQFRLTGVRPKKVQADPFTTSTGVEMRGGYYPLVFDTKMSKKAFQRDQKLNTVELLETNFLQATTRQGHTKERTDSNGQFVKLDIGVITQHLNNVIHDLAFREALLSVDKVIQDSRTENAVTRIMSREMYNELRPWLAAVAKPNPTMMNTGERLAKGLRKNATIVSMGFKFTTAWMQPLGLSQSVDLLGAGVVMKEAGKFFTTEGRRMWKEVMAKSAFMRNRQQSFDRDIGDALKKLKGEKGMVKRMQEMAFAHIGFMDMTVSVPTWHAGYNKAISEGASEVDAIAMGDRAVRLSQSSGSAKDLSRFQQGNEYQKLYGMFYTYFNGYHNMLRRRLAMEGRKPWSLNKVMNHSMSFLYLSIIPAVLSELMVGRGPDEDDDEELIPWAIEEALKYPFMGIPFARDITSAATTPFGYNITPVAKGIEDIVKLAVVPAEFWEGEADEGTAKAIFMGTGYLFGLPARQMWTIIDNSMALAEGEDLDISEMTMLREVRE